VDGLTKNPALIVDAISNLLTSTTLDVVMALTTPGSKQNKRLPTWSKKLFQTNNKLPKEKETQLDASTKTQPAQSLELITLTTSFVVRSTFKQSDQNKKSEMNMIKAANATPMKLSNKLTKFLTHVVPLIALASALMITKAL
jgi:hypothetical protein